MTRKELAELAAQNDTLSLLCELAKSPVRISPRVFRDAVILSSDASSPEVAALLSEHGISMPYSTIRSIKSRYDI